MGYLLIPLVLPVLGMLWLRGHPPLDDSSSVAPASGVAS
jgi:EamA domain-containing membrane protein RarD